MGFSHHDEPGSNTFHVSMTPGGFEASMTVALDEAAAIAARFPKSYKVYPNTLSRETYRSLTEIPAGLTIEEQINHPAEGNETVGQVCIQVHLLANGVNGGINESGKARARKFLAKAEELGYTIAWDEPGDLFGIKALRYGGGQYKVGTGYLTKAQGLDLLA